PLMLLQTFLMLLQTPLWLLPTSLKLLTTQQMLDIPLVSLLACICLDLPLDLPLDLSRAPTTPPPSDPLPLLIRPTLRLPLLSVLLQSFY
ncbi:hypothetical protein B0I74DRAFT_140227, partial [Yarrowia lipolytica]